MSKHKKEFDMPTPEQWEAIIAKFRKGINPDNIPEQTYRCPQCRDTKAVMVVHYDSIQRIMDGEKLTRLDVMATDCDYCWPEPRKVCARFDPDSFVVASGDFETDLAAVHEFIEKRRAERLRQYEHSGVQMNMDLDAGQYRGGF